jgi:hypothetical protein
MKDMDYNLTNREKVDKIKKYQDCPFVHPLTCGNDSNHSNLKGIILKGEVVLFCPDCDYRQEWVPEIVYSVQNLKGVFDGWIF